MKAVAAIGTLPENAKTGAPPLPNGVFAAALLIATLLAYQPAWTGGMIWDDDGHITKPELRSLSGLWRIWFSPGDTQQYYPLTHSVFWLQYQLWGEKTLGYHLTNIVLHVAAAVLFMLVLRRLNVPGAPLAALIFALHPVHVESVAWISELKNTLSGVLHLAAALVYLDFDQSREKRSYWLAFGLFVLALTSKAVTATLPPALLVVFWWQRGHLEWRRDVVPLVPFFVYGICMGLFTAYVERESIGAQGSDFEFTWIERCLIAGRVVWFYLGKLIWPADLIFNYPRWEISQAIWWQYLFPLSALGLLIAMWLLRKKTRAPLAALLFFGGTLFPVLGFLNVYPFIYSFVADHFQYLPSLGIISLVAAGAALLAGRWQIERAVAVAGCVVLALMLGTLTWRQSQQYADMITLYRATLERNPTSWLCHHNLGSVALARQHYEEAVEHLQNALRYRPNYVESHFGLGIAKQNLGQIDEAKASYRDAVRYKPDHWRAQFNLGVLELRTKHYEQAADAFEKVVRIVPDHELAYNNLGFALENLGRHEAAITCYRQALDISPDAAGTHYHLGNVLAKVGRLREAIAHLEEALSLQPDFPEAREKLAEIRAAEKTEKKAP